MTALQNSAQLREATLKKDLVDEQELIRLLKAPRTREAAFGKVLALYKERIYWHIRKILLSHDDADDVVQNTFIKVWRSIEGFREESKLKTWIYRIATNESITFLNSRKKRAYDDLTDLQNSVGHSQQHGDYMDGDEIQMKLQRAVQTLPDKQKLVFNMKYFDDMKYVEIAEVLGGSVGSLKASFHHAVKKIEAHLKTA